MTLNETIDARIREIEEAKKFAYQQEQFLRTGPEVTAELIEIYDEHIANLIKMKT